MPLTLPLKVLSHKYGKLIKESSNVKSETWKRCCFKFDVWRFTFDETL